jgi:CysZ protein
MMSSYRYTARALKSALRNVFHPSILAVLLVPAIGAILIWMGLSWWFWDNWTGAIESALVGATSDGWVARLDLARFAGFTAVLTVLLLIAPAIMVTAILISAVFAMPIIVAQVARRDYPDLERRRGGTFVGSIVNAVTSISAFALLWIITLPLWLLLGPLAAIVPLALSAYLNQRLFRYDALSEHASQDEMRRIFSERFSDLFVMGLATGLLYFVPIVNLVAPVFAALAFTCLCFDELERMRADEGAVPTAADGNQ